MENGLGPSGTEGALIFQDGRKPNWNQKNQTRISETELVAVCKETGESGNWRNGNRSFEPISNFKWA